MSQKSEKKEEPLVSGEALGRGDSKTFKEAFAGIRPQEKVMGRGKVTLKRSGTVTFGKPL